MTVEWSGRTTAYSHKFEDWKDKPCDGTKALAKVWYLNVQWSDCPVEVEKEVIALWKEFGLGNDNYILKLSINSLEELKNDNIIEGCIIQYILEQIPDIGMDETIIVHWWW